MKPSFLTIASLTAIAGLGLVSCTKNLNREPPNSITAAQVFSTPAGAKQALAKVYGAYGLTGSQGSGSGDLGGIDAGTSDFLRLLWDVSELSTDEAVFTPQKSAGKRVVPHFFAARRSLKCFIGDFVSEDFLFRPVACDGCVAHC